MRYTDSITLYTMKQLNLLDDIPYKYLKDIIHDEDYDEEYFDVKIEDVECDRVAYCKTRFTFKLDVDICDGSLSIMRKITFVVEREYNGSSYYALMMIELEEEEEEEEEE